MNLCKNLWFFVFDLRLDKDNDRRYIFYVLYEMTANEI